MRASGDERHLFMWVDSTDPDANAAMATFALPGPPRLDDGIDCVWVGLWQRNVNLQSNAGILWRLTPPGTWENVHVPLVRDYALAVVGGPVAVHGDQVVAGRVGAMPHSNFSRMPLWSIWCQFRGDTRSTMASARSTSCGCRWFSHRARC